MTSLIKFIMCNAPIIRHLPRVKLMYNNLSDCPESAIVMQGLTNTKD